MTFISIPVASFTAVIKSIEFSASLIAEVPNAIIRSTLNSLHLILKLTKHVNPLSNASVAITRLLMPPIPIETPSLAECKISKWSSITSAINKLNVFVPKSITAKFILRFFNPLKDLFQSNSMPKL